MSDIRVKFKTVDGLDPSIVDRVKSIGYATADSAGIDLISTTSGVIEPQRHALIPTGVIMELPRGFEGQVRPRSGLALKHNVTVLNSPGTIDSDYRGEIRVILFNHGPAPFSYSIGDKIAQLVVSPIVKVALILADDMSVTDRGTGGFGSTGGVAL